MATRRRPMSSPSSEESPSSEDCTCASALHWLPGLIIDFSARKGRVRALIPHLARSICGLVSGDCACGGAEVFLGLRPTSSRRRACPLPRPRPPRAPRPARERGHGPASRVCAREPALPGAHRPAWTPASTASPFPAAAAMLCRCQLLSRICPSLFSGEPDAQTDGAEEAGLLDGRDSVARDDVAMQRPEAERSGMLTEEQIRNLVDSQVGAPSRARGRGARPSPPARCSPGSSRAVPPGCVSDRSSRPLLTWTLD